MTNKTSLLYWWPKVKDLGINVPMTVIVEADRMEILGAIEGENELSMQFRDDLKAAAAHCGYPVFVRTDLASGKHSWKYSCFVAGPDVLVNHTLRVCEENELAQMIGLDYRAIVLREFLQLETSFLAFDEFPVNKERRYFVRNGKVICHHPYWPEEAIDGYTEDPDWKDKLSHLNTEDEGEVAVLIDYAERVGEVLGGCWSVDFAKTKSGEWYLIDMALGKESFHWNGCENESLLR